MTANWRTTAVLAASLVLGAGAAVGLSACGEDREGDVEIEEGGTTGGTTTGGEGTTTAP